MREYTFRIMLAQGGIVTVSVSASGQAAAENAVRGMYPGCTVLNWS